MNKLNIANYGPNMLLNDFYRNSYFILIHKYVSHKVGLDKNFGSKMI